MVAQPRLTRRRWLAGCLAPAAAGALATLPAGSRAQSPPGAGAAELSVAETSRRRLAEAMKEIVGQRRPVAGGIRLIVPQLADNGNSVDAEVEVDSPMTAEAYVKAIHVIAPRNPRALALSAFIGPDAGRARVAMRLRLAGAQTIHAVAEMSDGSVRTTSSNVDVALGACLENG